ANGQIIWNFKVLWFSGSAGSWPSPCSIQTVEVREPMRLSALALSYLCFLAPAFGVDIHAHRGGGVEARISENSLRAFMANASKGFSHLELDVQVSSDGDFIISHDSSLTASHCEFPYGNSEVRILQASTNSLEQMRCRFGLEASMEPI